LAAVKAEIACNPAIEAVNNYFKEFKALKSNPAKQIKQSNSFFKKSHLKIPGFNLKSF